MRACGLSLGVVRWDLRLDIRTKSPSSQAEGHSKRGPLPISCERTSGESKYELYRLNAQNQTSNHQQKGG